MAGTIDLSAVCGCCACPCEPPATIYVTLDIPCLYASPIVVPMTLDPAATPTNRIYIGALSPTSTGCGLAGYGLTARGVYTIFYCDGGQTKCIGLGILTEADFATGAFIAGTGSGYIPTVNCVTIDEVFNFTTTGWGDPFVGTGRVTT